MNPAKLLSDFAQEALTLQDTWKEKVYSDKKVSVPQEPDFDDPRYLRSMKFGKQILALNDRQKIEILILALNRDPKQIPKLAEMNDERGNLNAHQFALTGLINILLKSKLPYTDSDIDELHKVENRGPAILNRIRKLKS